MRKHSVRINGHATSISLEDEFWVELTRIARMRDLPIAQLIAEVDDNRDRRDNLSSALRLHVLRNLRKAPVS